MIVTIDGPAGAGKSSAARALARRLGFEFLDTGAMYRAVTLAALRAGLDLQDEQRLAGLMERLRLTMSAERVLLGSEDVTSAIRAAAVTTASGPVASSPAVRRKLVEMQRALAQGRNMVCEGRDQGTVVFPDAACKFFLIADPEERARRRQRDMLKRGEHIGLDEVLSTQHVRDQRDAARALGPMVPAADAILLDSTYLTLDEVVGRMEQEVRRRLSKDEG
jgi:cytidylate kinase